MSATTWKEYIRSNILDFRNKFHDLPEEVRELRPHLAALIAKPTQVVVFQPTDSELTHMLILHSENSPDMDTIVYEGMTSQELAVQASEQHPEWRPLVNLNKVKHAITHSAHSRGGYFWERRYYDNSLLWTFGFDPRSGGTPMGTLSKMLSNEVNDLLKTQREREKIEETVGDIRRDVEAIPEKVELRNKIIEATGRLEEQIKKLDKKYEEEISGFRKIVGTTKEFQDFRVFTTDVTDLKKSHVPREVFDAKVSELHTRINSLSEMKTEYDKLLSQQNEFMKQQAEVMKQQSSFVTWIKYSTILVPVAVVSAPIIYALLRRFLGIP